MNLCKFKCSQEGIYQLKSGEWCCSKNWQSCPEVSRKVGNTNSVRMKAFHWKNPNHRINHGVKIRKRYSESPEIRMQISKKVKSLWEEEDYKENQKNSHKDFHPKEETKNKQSESHMKWWKIHPEEKEKKRNWMKLNGNRIRKLIKRTSINEIKLREIVKEFFPTSEHTYKVLENRDYDVDIVLPGNKVAIEYDGWFHFDTKEHKEYHKKRQQEIEQEGWKFLRYNIFQKFPTKEQVRKDINNLLGKLQ